MENIQKIFYVLYFRTSAEAGKYQNKKYEKYEKYENIGFRASGLHFPAWRAKGGEGGGRFPERTYFEFRDNPQAQTFAAGKTHSPE